MMRGCSYNPIRRKVLLSAFTGLTGLLSWRVTHARAAYGIVGKIAPELTVPYWIDQHGQPSSFSLAEARGKWVFLKCFQNWCPGCHSHGFPALKKVADAFVHHDGVTVAGIQTVFEGFSSNTRDAVRRLQLRYQLAIPMGHDAGDPDGDHLPTTMRNYRTGGTPWMILIDPSGAVVYNDYSVDANRLIDFLNKENA